MALVYKWLLQCLIDLKPLEFFLNGAELSSGGSKGGRRGCANPSRGSKFFQFHAVFWEILAKSYVGAPPGELAPPPRGNPGSATAFIESCLSHVSYWQCLSILVTYTRSGRFESFYCNDKCFVTEFTELRLNI